METLPGHIFLSMDNYETLEEDLVPKVGTCERVQQPAPWCPGQDIHSSLVLFPK
jgi:hypothetical protein